MLVRSMDPPMEPCARVAFFVSVVGKGVVTVGSGHCLAFFCRSLGIVRLLGRFLVALPRVAVLMCWICLPSMEGGSANGCRL